MGFKFVDEMMNGKTTRQRSKKQETNIAKVLGGKTTINSGATFGENDVITDYCEIEAKTTEKESYKFNLEDWRKLRKKCKANKMPIFVLDFEKSKDRIAMLTFEDLEFLISLVNSPK